MAPVPHRGKRNEPSYVHYIAKRIAQIKRVAIAEVAEVTTENAVALFALEEVDESS